MKRENYFLLVGLGNPGQKYANTRHNIGFSFIDRLIQKNALSVKDKNNYLLSMMEKGQKKIFLLKPMMYMNLSGIPTLHVASYYKIPPENIIVVYDDIALPLGKLRIRANGSAGGHNGVKSLIENLGKENFIRLRLGIGEPPQNKPLEDYVLEPFSSQEIPVIEKLLSISEEAFWYIIEKGVEAAMNQFNGK